MISDCGWIWRSAATSSRPGGSWILGGGRDRISRRPGCIRISRITVRTRLIVLLIFVFAAVGFGYAALHQKTVEPPKSPEASKKFVVGRWQVNQKVGAMEGGTIADYLADGSFKGKSEVFVNGQGRMQPISGRWSFTKLASDEFRISLQYPNGNTWQGVFRIVDQNHIHKGTSKNSFFKRRSIASIRNFQTGIFRDKNGA